MSLINDALKKAQKLQSPQSDESAPVPGPDGPVAAPADLRPDKSMGFERLLLGIVAFVVVLVGVTVIAVLVWRKENRPVIAAAPRTIAPAAAIPASPAAVAQPVPTPAPPPVAASTPATESVAMPATAVAAPPAPAPVAEPPAAAVATPAVSSPAPSLPPPVSPALVSEPPPQTVASQPPPAIPVAASVSAPVTTPPPAPASLPPPMSVQVNLSAPPVPTPAAEPPAQAAKVEPPPTAIPYARRVLAYIDNLHVTGVRAAGDDSKVLMNDRVYHVNDMVEHELGVRLTGVSTTVLIFADENGKIYTKSLQ